MLLTAKNNVMVTQQLSYEKLEEISADQQKRLEYTARQKQAWQSDCKTKKHSSFGSINAFEAAFVMRLEAPKNTAVL
ncbi:MAG: hypothetical protein IJ861_06360 [Clostridia bacterium]|nr:hypothetical protein [Clostridia bacterium]